MYELEAGKIASQKKGKSDAVNFLGASARVSITLARMFPRVLLTSANGVGSCVVERASGLIPTQAWR